MAGVAKQIIGSFEDIGKDVVREITKVPTDIVGKAIESLGTSSPKKQQTVQAQAPSQSGENKTGALKELDDTKDVRAKKAIARAALAQIAGPRQPNKEPSVWERLQKEKEDKANFVKRQVAASLAGQLPKISGARKRGDLYGIQAKKAGSEIGKNVRQD
jgi:hypothetical protein